MNCIECSTLMVRGPVTLQGTYRGKELSVPMDEGWSCQNCGYATIHGRQSEEFSKRLKEEYRRVAGLLEADELRAKRKMLGMTQDKFAEVFDVAIASLKRWESGEVPERASDQLLRIKLDPQYAEAAVQESFFTLTSLSGVLRDLPVTTLESVAFDAKLTGSGGGTFLLSELDEYLFSTVGSAGGDASADHSESDDGAAVIWANEELELVA
jgi:putative zinc finger/helix-turn-helix YgiT family protein